MVKAGAVPPVPPWLINLVKRPEPKPTPESSAAGSREQAYARAALDRIAAEIAATPKGTAQWRAQQSRLPARRHDRTRVDLARRSRRPAARGELRQWTGARRWLAARPQRRSEAGIEAGLKQPHEGLEDHARRNERDGVSSEEKQTERPHKRGGKRRRSGGFRRAHAVAHVCVQAVGLIHGRQPASTRALPLSATASKRAARRNSYRPAPGSTASGRSNR